MRLDSLLLCNPAQTVTPDCATLEVQKNLRSPMQSARVFAIAVAFIVSAQSGAAQDLYRYRVYTLESSVASVVEASSVRLIDVKALHERPAKIQELEWRAPYVNSGSEMADPVRRITFGFYNDALYQVVVTYDDDRTDGLTNNDIIKSLSVTYGEPVLSSARSRPAEAPADTVVLAQWQSTAASLTLVRGTYSPEFQLVFVSKPLSTLARSAMREATRLDALEAPRREREQRKKEAADTTAARDKAHATNKAAFRP